jgi:LPXTG-motif cell wall-anchored protein
MNRTRFAVAAFVASAFAAVALGQNADKNSAGPTKNDYRLRVVEPAEGGVITGATVRVVVNTEIPSEAGDARRDVNSMPRPDVDVFLDGQLKGTMRDAQNVLEIESVNAGPHSLVLLAKNRANEIIDRKAIEFSSTASAAASSGTTTDTLAASSSTDGAWARADKPAATTATTDVSSARDAQAATPPSAYVPPSTSAPPPSTMIAQAPPPPAPRPVTQPRTLPETSTSDPSLALAGAGLLLAGFLVRRLAA